MGLVLKSAFWLGVVYFAMPLGQLPTLGEASDLGASACSSVSAALADRLAQERPYRLGATEGCAVLATLRGEASPSNRPTPASDPRNTPPQVSVQTLTDADRQPPWMGGDRQTIRERSTQSWRAGRPIGYKRVANIHPEVQTAND